MRKDFTEHQKLIIPPILLKLEEWMSYLFVS